MKILPAKTFVLLYFRIDDQSTRPHTVSETEFSYIFEPSTIIFRTGLSDVSIKYKCDCWVKLSETVNMAFLEKDVLDI